MAAQGFGGLLFGQGGSGLEDYLTQAQQDAIQQQGMMSAAAALLAASGERPVGQGIGIGQALGNAFQAGQQGYTQAQQGAINTLLAKEKLREAKMNADWAAGGGVIPTAGMPVGGAAPVGAAGGLQVPAGGAPTPQGMVNIGGFNVTPAQAALLRQMPRKEAMSEILKMTQNQYTPMTPEEAAQAGLQPNAVYYKSPQGKPEVIYRPDYETITKPDGSMIWVDKNDPFGRSVPPSKVKSDVSSGKATVNQPAPAGAGRTPTPAGNAPVYAGGFAAALKPEQITSAAQDWDKNYRAPVENILSSYNIVKDLVTTGEGGISDYGVLIKALKALDPNSAVMQGEAQSAAQMQGLADRMQGLIDKVQAGGVGSEVARMQLANLARSSASVAIDAYNRQAQRKAELLGQYMPQAAVKSIFQPFVKPSDLTSKIQMEKEMKANTLNRVTEGTWKFKNGSWVFE